MLSSRLRGGRAVRLAKSASRRRTYASIAATLPSPGDELHGFTLERRKHVAALDLTALQFTHHKTGAQYLHVARDDPNNVFCIGFRTNPPDATGVPHILEHVTLCGSEKFPVRDPFFKMLPRSLQNFMNAMTAADHTMYPFATTNAQDFRNLMSVYMDATLHPLLERSDFLQEGWRLGPADLKKQPDSASSKDLEFKGVVYNEMKGQVSDATYLFYVKFMEQIIPALNNSGGDPQKITDLTWEQLRQYHAEHYNPSNSRIITYGNQPLDDHLQMLGELLGNFDRTSIDADLKQPIELNGSKEIIVPGPIDPLTPPEAQYKTSISWFAGSSADIKEGLALQLLNSLLLDGYGAPLYRALIESGLGTDFTPNTGYDPSHAKGVFSIGLTGVREENVPKVKEVIRATLREQAAKGFDRMKVEGYFHVLEMSLKHKTANFGLNLAQRAPGAWFNGVDPLELLDSPAQIEDFKQRYGDGSSGYLEGLLERYLLNDNALTFTMVPSSTYGEEVATEEQERLARKVADAAKRFGGEAEAYEALREQELKLEKEQEDEKEANVDLLPTLRVNDISREGVKETVRDSTVEGNVPVQWRETATNGLTYFTGLAKFQNLPDELRMLVPLFCDALMRIGTKIKSMEELEDLIKLKTGGISFRYHSATSPDDILKATEGFAFSGRAFDGNVEAMYDLIRTILTETDFESPRAYGMLKELLRAGADGAVDNVAASGHRFAMMSAAAGLSARQQWVEETGGLKQVDLVTLLASAEEDAEAMSSLITKLRAIQSAILHSIQHSGFRAALVCGKEATPANETALSKFIASTRSSASHLANPTLTTSVSTTTSTTPPSSFPHLGQKSFYPFPSFHVSYTSLTVPTGPYTNPRTASHAILAQLLTHKHLHREIREKGGAYGGGATSAGLGGFFSMYSYRDPNPANSLRVMRSVGRWAREREWKDRELEEAKLSVFQAEDRPKSVSAEGMGRFLEGVDEEMRQRRREALLDVDVKDVREAAEKVAEGLEDGRCNVAVLGREGVVETAAEGWSVRSMGVAKGMEEY